MRLSLDGVNLRGEALPVDGADPRDPGETGKLASALGLRMTRVDKQTPSNHEFK